MSVLWLSGWNGATGATDCSSWALDGYHLGMLGTELLAVRSVTLHVEGQAQAIESGRGPDVHSRSVHATLTRASSLKPGLVEMKTLFH